MKRKNFLKSIALAPFVVAFINSCKSKKLIPGKITGATAAIGHLLRDKPPGEKADEVIEKKVVIVGAGISGLSAARALAKGNVDDFIVLELESYPGGNSSYASNEISAYPQGAHYIPVPNVYLSEYISFLQDHGVITGFDEKGFPFYNEMYLCFDSQERLFINGNWQEGIVPKRGLQPGELEEIDRFFSIMNHFRERKGTDDRYAFDIPVDQSSRDETFQQLDRITMKQWLLVHNFNNAYLHWYVNYCTRDDFATSSDKVSAWAGIHYFASRKGLAANASHSDVLTWPEGNGFLMNKLLESCKNNIRTNALTTSVKPVQNVVEVTFIDTITQKRVLVKASHCILACPQYVSGRLLKDEARQVLTRTNFFYTPWLVANIKTVVPAGVADTGLSWDNVAYGSPSLGYVNATHQLPQQFTPVKNLTWYLPFTTGNSKAERTRIAALTHEDYCDLVIADLEKVHPGIGDLILEINVTLWGHSMVQPLPGFIFGEARKKLSASIGNNIHFAHTDIAGISIFEEGFYQGINAARKVTSNL